MNADEFDSLTERVLSCAFEVSNTLGAGFLEKVYERALLREFGMRRIRAAAQRSFTVRYQGHYVGEYFADLASEHIAQCLNYLRVSGLTLCLLINFQKPKVEWKRLVSGFSEL